MLRITRVCLYNHWSFSNTVVLLALPLSMPLGAGGLSYECQFQYIPPNLRGGKIVDKILKNKCSHLSWYSQRHLTPVGHVLKYNILLYKVCAVQYIII